MTLEYSKLVKELTGTIIQNINEYAKYTKSDRDDEFGEKFEECVSNFNVFKFNFSFCYCLVTEIINYIQIEHSKY